MKIVYCLPQLYKPGGIERIISIKANYLAEACHYDVTIITAIQKGKAPYYKLLPQIRLIDLNLDYDSLLKLPLFTRIYKKRLLQKKHKEILSNILYQIKPDITISTFTHEASFLPDIKDGSKKILEFHFCRKHKQLMAKAFKFPLITRFAYYLKCWQEENVIIPKYDQFVVLTEEDKLSWSSKIKNVLNIPNILTFRTSPTINTTRNEAIAVGRLDAQKGFDILIPIWEKIHKKCPEWILNIYGQGEDETKLKKLIAEKELKDSIIIHQASKNIIEEYEKNSLLLMTSRYEGWGLVLTEAMQCGLPVIAFACKCGPRDIITNGEDGFCIDEGDENDFISKTVLLMKDDNKRIKMGYNAQKNVQRYSADKIMPLWINLFNKLIKQ